MTALQGSTVFLTGATGFVGSELLRQLLLEGAHVKAAVRQSSESPQRLEALKNSFAGLPGSLELVEVDILSPATLEPALKGVQYIFHVASPFVITAENPAETIIRPAVEGTSNVLRAAAAHKDTLKRTVVTSSVCAIHDCHAKQPRKGELYCEEDWNDTSTPQDEPYWVSKVEAERAAWQLAKELGLDVVTILPNFIMGPPASPHAAKSLSVGFMKAFIESSPGGASPPSGSWTFSDVRDVARAHVLAATQPAAAGRYIISQPMSLSAKRVTDILKSAGLGLEGLPDGEEQPEGRNIDASRVSKDLGLAYTPIEATLRDMAKALIEQGLAKPAVPVGPAA